MQKSHYTTSAVKTNGEGILVNLLTGAVDFVPANVARTVESSGNLPDNLDENTSKILVERGYYTDSRSNEEVVARFMSDKAKQYSRESNTAKAIIAVTMDCNLRCGYCWQRIDNYDDGNKGLISKDVVDKVFDFLFSKQEYYKQENSIISLFGGEPLINRKKHHDIINYIGEKCNKKNCHMHITTNGKDIKHYTETINRFNSSIQITVDGFKIINSGYATLSRAGQDLLGTLATVKHLSDTCSNNIHIRFLASPETVRQFIAMCDYFYDYFKNIGNITLAIAPIQTKAFANGRTESSKISVLKRLLPELKNKPYSNKLAYLDWRSLSLFSGLRTGIMFTPFPAFYHCEANDDLLCFDAQGKIYTCYEAIGNDSFAVGTLGPPAALDQGHLSLFRDRRAFDLENCQECVASPICGGGCQIRSIKRNQDYMTPYCDSLQEELRFTLQNWDELHQMIVG